MKAIRQLELAIERASKTYLKKNIDKYTDRITSVVKQWRKWVRQNLSVPYEKGTLNKTLYPKLRSGELRNSLVTRRVHLKSIDKLTNNRVKATLVVPISYTKLKNNYGDILNRSKASYGGWKDRVQAELERRIKGRL